MKMHVVTDGELNFIVAVAIFFGALLGFGLFLVIG